MNQKTVIIMAVLMTTVVSFYACLKGSAGEAATESVRYTVNEWKKSWITLPSQTKISYGQVLAKLDYTESQQIKRADQSILTLIKIRENAGSKTANYLGIARAGNAYVFEGIFSARDIDLIQTFYSIGALPPSESLMVSDINNFLRIRYQTDAEGKMHSVLPVSGYEKTHTQR
jgi:hypothetical protein